MAIIRTTGNYYDIRGLNVIAKLWYRGTIAFSSWQLGASISAFVKQIPFFSKKSKGLLSLKYRNHGNQ